MNRLLNLEKNISKNIFLNKYLFDNILNWNSPEGVLSPADILENAKSASGKFGGVAGVLHGVIYKRNILL